MKNTNQNRSLVTTPIYCSLLRIAKMSCGAKNSQICVDELPFQFEASDRDFVTLTNGWVKFSGQQLIDAGLSARDLVNMGYTHDMMIAAGFCEAEKNTPAEVVKTSGVCVFEGEGVPVYPGEIS